MHAGRALGWIGLALLAIATSRGLRADEAEDSGPVGAPPTELPQAEAPAEDLPPDVELGPTDVTPDAPPAPLPTTPAPTSDLLRDGLTRSELLALPSPTLRRSGSHDVLSPRRVQETSAVGMGEIAARLPGVSSRLYSGDEHLRPSISVRGMPDNGFTEYTAVHVDGINFGTVSYGWTAISIFPFSPERIWAAEVHRGAHALRYGPNTIGGVVNFLTTPIPDDTLVRTRLTIGGHGYVSAFAEVGDRVGPWSWLAQVVSRNGSTFRDNSDFEVQEVALKVRRDIGRRSWLQVEGFHWRDVHQLQSRLTWDQYREDRNQNLTLPEANWSGWAYGGTLRWHHRWNCDSWIEAYAHYRLAHRALDSMRPPAGPPFTAIRSADSDNISAEAGVEGETRIACNHVLHYGARFHWERVDRTTFEDPIGGGPRTVSQDARNDTQAISFWMDDTMRFGRFTLTAGARVEWIPESTAEDDITGNSREFDYFDVFPGVSASYQLSPQLAVFGNWHRSFRSPQVWGYDFNAPDQELDFEHGTNIEVGVNGKDLFGCGCLSGSATLWRVEFSDFLDYDPLTDIYTNLGGFDAYGVDLTGEVDLGRCSRRLCGWRAFGTVTWQQSEFDGGENDGQDTTHVPEWLGHTGVRYEHRSGLYGVAEALYHGSSWANVENTVRSPSDWIVQLRAGWRTCRRIGCLSLELDAAIVAKNALDEEVYLVHAPNSIVPGAGRELFGSFQITVRF